MKLGETPTNTLTLIRLGFSRVVFPEGDQFDNWSPPGKTTLKKPSLIRVKVIVGIQINVIENVIEM